VPCRYRGLAVVRSILVKPHVRRLRLLVALLAVAIPEAPAGTGLGSDPLVIPRAPLVIVAAAPSASETPEDERTARRRREDKEMRRLDCFYFVLVLVGACGLFVAWIRGKPVWPFRR
jgi:hypothetical protein